MAALVIPPSTDEERSGRRGTYHLHGKKPEVLGGKSNGSTVPYGKVQKTWV